MTKANKVKTLKTHNAARPALASKDWQRRLEEVRTRMAREGVDPAVVEMVLSQGASGLVRPSIASGGMETQLDGFIEAGALFPDSGGNLSFCVVAGMQFGHCVYTPGAVSTLGEVVPGGSPAQRQSKRNAFFADEASEFRYIAGGLTMWPVGNLVQSSGSVAIAVVPETYGKGTDFASVADLPGAVVMSVAEAYERGISVPMLLSPTRRVMPIDNGSGVAMAAQVTYNPNEFEPFQNVGFGANSMFTASTHFVRPGIMVAVTGTDAATQWLVEWRHSYEYVPKFRRETPVSTRSEMALIDAHAKAASLYRPEWIMERGAGPVKLETDEHEAAEAMNQVRQKVQKVSADSRGVAAPAATPVPRTAGRTGAVRDERRTLQKAVDRGKAKEPGFVDKSIARARKALKDNYPSSESDGWWNKTMGRAGDLFGHILDAAEFGYGVLKDFQNDEDAKSTVNSALATAAML